jgi:hypothetical protein
VHASQQHGVLPAQTPPGEGVSPYNPPLPGFWKKSKDENKYTNTVYQTITAQNTIILKYSSFLNTYRKVSHDFLDNIGYIFVQSECQASAVV